MLSSGICVWAGKPRKVSCVSQLCQGQSPTHRLRLTFKNLAEAGRGFSPRSSHTLAHIFLDRALEPRHLKLHRGKEVGCPAGHLG